MTSVVQVDVELQPPSDDEPRPIEVSSTMGAAGGAISTVTHLASDVQTSIGDGPHPDSILLAVTNEAAGSDEATSTAQTRNGDQPTVGGTTCPDPKATPAAIRQAGSGGSLSPSDQSIQRSAPRVQPADPMAFLELRILAESFADTQANRIACLNRMERGGVPPDLFAAQIEALIAAEHAIELALVRRYRNLVRSSLPGVDAWQKNSKGIGEKLLARLLGHLGHPTIAYPYHWGDDASAAHVCGPSCRAGRHLIADEPFYRTVAQLRSYCGHGDPERKRHRGMSVEEAAALGSPGCKMLVHLLAEACMKQVERPATAAANPTVLPPDVRSSVSPTNPITANKGESSVLAELSPEPTVESSPKLVAVRDADPTLAPCDIQVTAGGVRYVYRQTYDARRIATTDRVHATECLRCGPSGKPAQIGSSWSKAHQHADALRIVGKAILDDLWEAARG